MIWSARGSHFSFSLTVAQRLSFTSSFIFGVSLRGFIWSKHLQPFYFFILRAEHPADYLKHSRCEFHTALWFTSYQPGTQRQGYSFCFVLSVALRVHAVFCCVLFFDINILVLQYQWRCDFSWNTEKGNRLSFLFTGDASSYQNIRMNLISSHLQENGSSPDMKMILK